MRETELSMLLERLLRDTGWPKKRLVRLAFDLGLRHFARAHLLGRYLRNELSRPEAVQAVGEEWVRIAESHPQLICADLDWLQD